MAHGKFFSRVGARKKVTTLSILLSGLLLVTVLTGSAFASTGAVSLPEFQGFSQIEFLDFAGIRMDGQTLSIDFLFSRPVRSTGEPVSSELFFQTGAHKSSGGDYPYTDYVVFSEGTSAYLIDEYGAPLGATAAAGVLSTDHGWAGASMNAYPEPDQVISGIHFDLVLPNSGESLFLGRIGIKTEGIPLAPPADNISPGEGSSPLPEIEPGDAPHSETPPAPISSKLITAGPFVREKGASEAVISWTTERSNVFLEFGNSKSYGQSVTPVTIAGESFVHLKGLVPGTTYHFRLTSYDGSDEVTGEDNSFVTDFFVPNLGGIRRTTDDRGPMTSSYARIRPKQGTTPSGLTIFEIRSSSGFLREVAVPAARLITTGRTFYEVRGNGAIDTGLVFTNPNSTDATIDFELRSVDGEIFRTGTFTVTGRNQLGAFLDDRPFSSGRDTEGTLTFTSSSPIAVVALRQLYYGSTFSELVIESQPVIDLSVSSDSGEQMIPHFSVGDGMKTQIVLVNPTGKDLRGRLQFLNDSGGAAFADTRNADLMYLIKSNSEQRFDVPEPASGSDSGSIVVTPVGDSLAPGVFAIVSYKPQGDTIAEAIVPVAMGSAFRIYAVVSSPAQIDTTVFVGNPTDRAGTVTLSFTNMDGEFIASKSLPLGPQGRLAVPVATILGSSDTMRGILRISSDLPTLAAGALRSRDSSAAPPENFAFTAIPATLETATPTSEERIFGRITNGGGLPTGIILYSGSAGEISQGELNFVSPDGEPLSLDIH
jgi:hypothetical protein